MINTIQRAFWAQLPDWARPTNAIFRYVRQQQSAYRGGLWQWLRWTGSLTMLAGLVTLSYVAAQNDTPFLMDSTVEHGFFAVLYAPLVVMQIALYLIALSAVGGAVSAEQQRGTWEAFKITTHGAELVIRARWAALFYQMRWLLVVLIGARLALIAVMLVDLTEAEGDYLELFTSGITPAISLEVAVLLLAALMAAAVLQVVVLMGLNAALGLLLVVVVQNRSARTFVYGIIVLAEWGLWAWTMTAGRRPLDGGPALVAGGSGSTEHWLGVLGMSVAGDQGLRLLDLRTYLQTWPDIRYGALISAAWLAALFVQVLITDRVLILTGRLAARPNRE